MKKITENLRSEIDKHPEKLYRILIVLKDGAKPEQLSIKKYKVLMDTILSSELKGSEILRVAKLEPVVSIEPDEEVEIS